MKEHMKIRSEEFVKQIDSSAQDRLTKSALGITYTLQEQGGVKITESSDLKLSPETQTKITSLLGITELTSQLRQSLFEQASKNIITDSSKFTPEQTTVFNQNSFVQELLGSSPKLLDKLAEIIAKTRIFSDILQGQLADSMTEELGIKVVAWEKTINEIAQILCKNDSERTYFQGKIEDNIVKANSPIIKTIKEDGGRLTTVNHESYSQKLGKLIKKPRAISLISSYLKPRQGESLAENLIDEYLETAFTLNAVRVLDRIQRPIGINGKLRKLMSCLEEKETDPVYTQIIESNNLASGLRKVREEIDQINKLSLSKDGKKQKIEELNYQYKERCRQIIEGAFNKETDTDEFIDLVETKQGFIKLQERAQEIKTSPLSEVEKQQQIADLDRQMQDFFIPIANKVDRIFPHQSSTNLANVLKNEDAICAGKVNVLLAVSKYLGVNARANLVEEMLDNKTDGHVCLECDLPSGSKLVIDASFGNRYEPSDKTDKELMARIIKNNPDIAGSEIESALNYIKLAITNSRFIPENSRIFMYITEYTPQVVTNIHQLQEIRENPQLLVRINPYTGKSEIWKANIPYPHLITAPDKNGYLFINSSFANNSAHFVLKDYKDIGVYLFKKHIEMNPYSISAYTGLVNLLPEDEGLVFLEKIKREKSAFYWEGLSVKHALAYINKGNINKATQIFEEMKINNHQEYYQNIYNLAEQFIKQADEKTGGTKSQHRSYAISLMEQARRENPSLFYSQSYNALIIIRLYDDPNKKIEIYEEFKSIQKSAFWNTNNYSPHFEELMKLYLKQAKENLVARDKAIKLADEIKDKDNKFYTQRIYQYVSDLYLDSEQKNIDQATIMLEEAKNNSPEIFFQENGNITTLANIYKIKNNNSKAIDLYKEASVVNPDLFWYQAYNNGYIELVDLYVKAGNLSKAVSISLEAQDKDPNFYNPKINGGYLQLATLYEKNDQLDESINIILRGQEIDENFWSTDYGTPNAFRLIDIYEKEGKSKEAIAVLEQVRNKNSNYWKTDYFRICKLYEKNGDIEKAKQIRFELIDVYEGLKTTDLNTYYASSGKLARLYLSEKQIQKAIQTLEESKKHYLYFSIQNIIFLAELYIQAGDLSEAKLAYQDAIERCKEYSQSEYAMNIAAKAKTEGIELII